MPSNLQLEESNEQLFINRDTSRGDNEPSSGYLEGLLHIFLSQGTNIG